jgi:hypothetical protein
MRTVIAHRETFKHHLRCGEYLIVVRRFVLNEPLAWNNVPYVMRLATEALERWAKANEFANDPDKRAAISAWRSRQTWLVKRSLDLAAICYT